ncbi:hypothetical protein C8R43DRAFT_1110368 [Mycena crocata]|nr:hypothetical protein C8R43DRAFT_1110368 [Mycena crocata]
MSRSNKADDVRIASAVHAAFAGTTPPSQSGAGTAGVGAAAPLSIDDSILQGIQQLGLGSAHSSTELVHDEPVLHCEVVAPDIEGKTSWIDLQFEARFREAGLRLQFIRPWKFVSCTEDDCHVGIAGEELVHHLKAHRKALHIPSKLLSDLAVAGAWMQQSEIQHHIPRGIIAPVICMKVRPGQECNHPACPRPLFVGDHAAMQIHFEGRHPDTPFKDVYIREVSCQSLRITNRADGAGKRSSHTPCYFRVYPTLNHVDTRTEYGRLHRYLLQNETWKLPTFRFPQGDNELSPWLRKTGWHKVIQDANPLVIKARIMGEHAPDWLQPLVTYITHYINILEARRKDVNPAIFTFLAQDPNTHKNSSSINDYGKDYARPWAALLQLILMELEDPLDCFPVRMSGEVASQGVQLTGLLKSGTDITAIVNTIQSLFFALLSTCHKELQQDQTACPLARYIVLDCLEIGREGCKFMQPSQCRYKLRAFEYLFRMCIVQEAYRQSTVTRPMSQILTELLPHIQFRQGEKLSTSSTWAILQHTVWLSTYLDKGMARPNVFWSEDSCELAYMAIDQKLTMSRIRDYIHDLITMARQILRQKVVREAPEAAFEAFWAKIASIPDNAMGSDSLISHISHYLPNTPCIPGRLLLKIFMEAENPVFHVRLSGRTSPVWKTEAIRIWFTDVHQLVEYYCAAVSFLVGHPVSSAFLLNLAIQPSFGTNARANVAIHRGHLAFFSADATTTDLSARCQYIPNQLGHEIMFYLVYVRPLEEIWWKIALGDTIENSSKLWTTASRRWRWDTDDILKLTESISTALIGIRISKRHWRDIMNAILEQHLQSKKQTEKPQNRVADLATGHSSITGDRTAQTSWEQSTRWHELWGFGKEKGGPEKSIDDLGRRFVTAAESLNKLMSGDHITVPS